jgi:hypothetical protein
MKRANRIFKNLSLAGTIVVAVTFVCSLWMTFGFGCYGYGAWVGGGGLFVQVSATSNTHCGSILSSHTFGEFIYRSSWTWSYGWDDGVAQLPLGWIFILLVITSSVLWCRDRQHSPVSPDTANID